MSIYMSEKEIRKLWRNRGIGERDMIQCIADLNGCHFLDAKKVCEAYGLVPAGKYKYAGHSRWSREEIDTLYEMRSSGSTISEIAGELGRTEEAIKKFLYSR